MNDFAVTLLLLENRDRFEWLDSEPEQDIYERFTARS